MQILREKKKIFVLISFLVFVITFIGCAKNAAETDSSSANTDETERVVIMGEIVETIGNMVTINLIERREMPQMVPMTDEERAAMQERFENGEFGDFSTFGNITEEDRTAMRERFSQGTDGATGNWSDMVDQFTQNGGGDLIEQFSQNGGGDIIERFTQNGFDGFADMSEDELAGMVGEFFRSPGRRQNYTGESKDIIIPVGAPIMESSFTNGEEVQSEINLDKLKAGDIIEVTYASDGETVARVVKQSSQPTMRFGGDGSGFQGFPDFQIIQDGNGGQGFGFRISD